MSNNTAEAVAKHNKTPVCLCSRLSLRKKPTFSTVYSPVIAGELQALTGSGGVSFPFFIQAPTYFTMPSPHPQSPLLRPTDRSQSQGHFYIALNVKPQG